MTTPEIEAVALVYVMLLGGEFKRNKSRLGNDTDHYVQTPLAGRTFDCPTKGMAACFALARMGYRIERDGTLAKCKRQPR